MTGRASSAQSTLARTHPFALAKFVESSATAIFSDLAQAEAGTHH